MFQISGVVQPGGRFTQYVTLPADIVTWALVFAIAGAGLFFFVRIISAGFGFLTNGGDQNKIQNATKELTHAIIGLLLVISAYFIIQILQVALGINIVNTSTKSDQSPLDQIDRSRNP